MNTILTPPTSPDLTPPTSPDLTPPAGPDLTTPASRTVEAVDRPSVLGARVGLRSVTVAEWIKLRTVRSNVIGLLSAGAALVFLGAVFSSMGDSDQGPRGVASDSLAITFGGISLSQLVIGVLAALFVAGEYSTGMIRSMFGAVGRRTHVLAAKAAVFSGATWIVMTAAAVVTFFAGQAIYSGDMATYGIGDPGVLRAVLAVGFYGACVALIGVSLGFLFRSTAGSIGVLVALFMLVPVLSRLLPGELGDWVSKLTPSGAGDAIMSVTSPDTLLSPSAGLAVLLAWVVGLVGLAAVQVRRRDA